jgi:hypothetical protein
MDWLVAAVPEASRLEIGTGGYAPIGHCDMPRLLRETGVRRFWMREIAARDLTIVVPPEVGIKQAAWLLADALGVNLEAEICP